MRAGTPSPGSYLATSDASNCMHNTAGNISPGCLNIIISPLELFIFSSNNLLETFHVDCAPRNGVRKPSSRFASGQLFDVSQTCWGTRGWRY